MNNVLSYAQLMSGQNSLEAIKEGARLICDRRGRYADTISNDVERIKSEITVIESLIKTIEENSSVLDSKQESELKSLCKQLKTSLNAYLLKAQSLCKRFKNKKIKVVAFGLRTQGKSTFTRLYTGLPESVVAEKNQGDDLDKTGALSVISHQTGVLVNNPNITIHFKTCECVLKPVNDCIRQLSVIREFILPGCTGNGYDSWNDFKSVLANKSEKNKAYEKIKSLIDRDNQVRDFYPVKSFLLSVFEPESDFDEVKVESHSQEISLSELPLYNDMTNPGKRRYLSVERIDISADLGYEGAFENFEICDTKGISAKAGAKIVEEEIFNDINNSDAAFSIKNVGGGQDAPDFYKDLSNNVSNIDKLHNKHFAILNLYEGANEGMVDETVNAINGSNLAKCIYVGSLATQKNRIASYKGIEIDAKKFSMALIVDMLSKIVDSTKENDDLLINDCNNLVGEINNNQQLLNNFLLQLQNKSKGYTIEYMLLEKIESFRIAAMAKLEDLAKSNNIILPDAEIVINNSNSMVNSSLNDDEEDDDYTEETETVSSEVVTPMPIEQLTVSTPQKDSMKDIRIFRMITAQPNMDETDINALLRERRTGTTVSDIAISYILEQDIKPIAGSNAYMGENLKYATTVKGSATDIGAYIDSVSDLLYGAIKNNINIKYTGSQDIGSIVSLRNQLYSAIWKEFKFSALYGDFNEELLENNKQNKIINEWLSYYNKPKKDSEASAITPEVSYNILISYFSKLDYKPASILGAGPIIDWKLLKQSICEVYRRFNFEERVKEKLTNEEKLKRNIFVEMRESLRSTSALIGGVIGMYPKIPKALLDAKIFSSDEYKKISEQYKWAVLCNTREQLVSQNITSLKKIK